MADENRQKLRELAEALSPYATLYMVGGCVRDELMGIECSDIDVCSQLEVDDVKSALSNTDFVVSDKNLRMGTVHISCGDFVCEYTTFRTDSYNTQSGEHTPEDVKFTKDILLDARRRDFKCNAVYKDILQDEYVDLLGGIDDIRNKVLSTCDDPHIVFEADGLRILRLVRFCAELGFSIDEQTFFVAKQNAWRVKDIAVERIREELFKIFKADTKHPTLNLFSAHVDGIRCLDSLGLMEIVLPELSALKGLEQNKKYHLYDAYNHSIKAYEYAPPHLRFCALLHDIGKAWCVKENGNMHGHERVGADMARDIAHRYKLSNEQTYRLCKIIALHMTDLNGNTSENKLRRLIAENIDVIDDVCLVMFADARATSEQPITCNRISNLLAKMRDEGVPFSIKELKVSGNDLVQMGVDEKQRGIILHELWLDTVMNMSLNTRQKALAYIQKKL